VLSTADIGIKKVIPSMQEGRGTLIDAIASRDEARAKDAADRLGISKSYGSYEELLADPDIEAVYIPLPNHLHAQWTVAAAEAGKHVLCEKPLAMTSDDARRMISACGAAGVMLMEAFMYRLHPLWVGARDLIENGAIGEVRSIQAVFSYFNDDPGDIRNIPGVGGGALYDIGCYLVNTARMVFGSEPSDVRASIRRDANLGTDVLTSALLDFEGRHASIVCSTQMEPHQRVDIYGTEGRLVIEIPYNIPPDRATRILQIAGGDPPVAPATVVHEISPANPYTVQGDDFSTALRSGGPIPVPPGDAVANLEVMERIFADAAG
jgi:predicted dehydrogenase